MRAGAVAARPRWRWTRPALSLLSRSRLWRFYAFDPGDMRTAMHQDDSPRKDISAPPVRRPRPFGPDGGPPGQRPVPQPKTYWPLPRRRISTPFQRRLRREPLARGAHRLRAARAPVCRGAARGAGIGRGQVRMRVAGGLRVSHRRFDDLPAYLAAGNLVVFNTSATLPAAVDGALPHWRPVIVHFATALDDGTWAVEVRPAVGAHGPVASLAAGGRVGLASGAFAAQLTAYPDVSRSASRLWRAAISTPDMLAAALSQWPPQHLWVHAEEVAAGVSPDVLRDGPRRCRDAECRTAIHRRAREVPDRRGVRMAPITLHMGVSPPEAGEPPSPQRYRVQHALPIRSISPSAQAPASSPPGPPSPAPWRRLPTPTALSPPVTGGPTWSLGPERPVRVIDALITGWHTPGASHLLPLKAVASSELVRSAYEPALLAGYLRHEFGDSSLMLANRGRRVHSATSPPMRTVHSGTSLDRS